MWDFIKTSFSVLGLFIILVLVIGLYMSFIQEPKKDQVNEEINYKTLPGEATTTTNSTSSDFIDIDQEDSVLEDIPTY